MADTSLIEWTDATWQPITGCSIISPGCAECYAMRLAGSRLRNHPSRAGLTNPSKAGPVWNGTVRFNREWLEQPLAWSRPRRVFVCAHGDLFHEGVDESWIDAVFEVMARAKQHTFQVLTKRADRMRAYVTGFPERRKTFACHSGLDFVQWPLPNVWLGVSAERQIEADQRIPLLLETPAAVRFLSAEPLLGPIDLTRIAAPKDPADPEAEWLFDALATGDCYEQRCENGYGDVVYDSADGPHRETKLDMVIVGGENGSRPMHPEWARSLRDQCAGAEVPFFFKQWGSWWPVSQMGEDDIDRCYAPRPARDPEATRSPRVDTTVLHADGSQHTITSPGAYAQGSHAMLMFQVGKKKSGRLLDGVEHNGMPGAAA